MVRRRVSQARGGTARRIAVLAVLAPLSVAACVGLLRPVPGLPALKTVLPAAAGDPGPVPELLPVIRDAASVTGSPPASGGLGVSSHPSTLPVEPIPSRAWAAYDRTEVVMNAADPSCHLTWELVAAIGKVESDHGQYGGRLMTVDGLVHPALYGPRLDGRAGTSRIGDTDAGLLDGDRDFDRAVGPMQFIPSTWTLVGVDADGDGRRDPQDIDDASLATGVYLCSGAADLATTAGQRAAVHRYNHSESYVDGVLNLMRAYRLAGPGAWGVIGGPGYAPIAAGIGGPGPGASDTPEPTFEVVPTPSTRPSSAPTNTAPTTKPTATVSEVTPTATPAPTSTPPTVSTPRPTPTAPGPTVTPTNEPTISPTPAVGPSATEIPTSDPTPEPTLSPTVEPTLSPTVEPTLSPTVEPTLSPTVEPTLSPTVEPTLSPTVEPTWEPTTAPTDMPTSPVAGPTSPVVTAWLSCVDAGAGPLDRSGLTTCLLDATGLPPDAPAIVAVLALPAASLPEKEPTQQRRR